MLAAATMGTEVLDARLDVLKVVTSLKVPVFRLELKSPDTSNTSTFGAEGCPVTAVQFAAVGIADEA
jgi:hypothetical protein